MEVALIPPKPNQAKNLPAAQLVATPLFAFAGMYCNVTVLHVVPAAPVRQQLQALNYTLTMLFHGAKVEKQHWKTFKPFALYAILASLMCITANKRYMDSPHK